MYKTVQSLKVHFPLDYWLCSVSSFVLRKRNKCPRLKEKIYKPCSLTPLKTRVLSPCPCEAFQRPDLAKPSAPRQPRSEDRAVVTGRQAACCSPLPSDQRLLLLRGGRLSFTLSVDQKWNWEFEEDCCLCCSSEMPSQLPGRA